MGETNKKFEYLSLLILATAFLYTAIRAILISISHDEALTFLIHAQGSLGNIFAFRLPYQINNHLLHTLLVKFCLNIFGAFEPVMRIPALAGHLLYLSGVFLILRKISRGAIFFAGSLLLSTNPYLLDYFSCARGYGLGLGFAILGLYFLIQDFEGFRQNFRGYDALTGSMFLAFAALSNLTYLNVYVTLAGLAIISDVWMIGERRRRETLQKKPFTILFQRSLLPWFPSLIMLAILYTKPIILLRRVDQLCYGGSNGLWLNTIPSLVESTQYGISYMGMDVILWGRRIVALIILSACAVMGIKIITRKLERNKDELFIYFFALLILSGLCITTQHILLNTLYVIHRTAIYFIPIFYFFVIVFWSSVREAGNSFFRRSADILFSAFILILFIHFVHCANFHYFSDWKYDAGTKKMMTLLKSELEQRGTDKGEYSIGNTWLYEPGINYYRACFKIENLSPATRENPARGHDYYYLHDEDCALVREYNLTILSSDSFSQSVLAKSK